MAVGQVYPWRGISIGLWILLWASGTQADMVKKVLWDCSGGGDYSNLVCWYPEQTEPPYNRGALVFNVQIATASVGTVTFDVDAKVNGVAVNSFDVNDFYLGTHAAFEVPAGKSYSVLGAARLDGVVYGNRGNFYARSVAFPGETAAFKAEGGAQVMVGGASKYSARGINKNDDTLLSAVGKKVVAGNITARSRLDLPNLETLDDGFSAADGQQHKHTIEAKDTGIIDLSHVTRIIAPAGNGILQVTIDRGMIDMSSLTKITPGAGSSAGTVNFDVDNEGKLSLGNVRIEATTNVTLNRGATLHAAGLRASKPTTLNLKDPRDVLEVTGDVDLGTQLTISNSGHAALKLKGDFTYAHKVEANVPFRYSQVFFDGNSLPESQAGAPQELEVGGLDEGTSAAKLTNDNFGLGQMIIGREDPNSVVVLVDHIDNGNREVYAEALYLFGLENDPCGLRVENGSILYLGDLKVYAKYNGVMTDLSTLFEQDPKQNPALRRFDQGYLHRGRPDVSECRNIVRKGGFENGTAPAVAADRHLALSSSSTDLAPWEIAKNTVNWTHETDFADAGPGEWFVDLSSTKEGKGVISQVLRTPKAGGLYRVWFDVAPNPYCSKEGGRIQVSAAGTSEIFRVDPAVLVGPMPTRGQPWPVQWQTKTWRFRAQGETTTLTFAAGEDASTPFSVAIDNVIVLSPGFEYPVNCFELIDNQLTEPMLTLLFSKAVGGPEGGIVIQGPAPGAAEVPTEISGWKSSTLKVVLPTGLPDGRYTVTLKSTIFDLLGEPLNGGVSDKVFCFTLDTTPPNVRVDALGLLRDATPPLTGTVDDPNAQVTVTVADKTYPAQNNRDGTWTLADNAIHPPLEDGDYEVKAAATDLRGNVGQGYGRLTIDSKPPKATATHLVTYDPMPPLAGTIDDRDKQTTIVVTLVNRDSPATISGPYTAVNNRDGTWILPAGMIRYPLDPGVYDLTVTATDRAGNVSQETFRDILEIPPS